MLSLTATAQSLPDLSQFVPPAKERILFALTERERNQIFPLGEGELSESAQIAWVNPEADADWVRCLKDFRPTSLVSCWCTPQLPASMLFTEALPLRYVCHTTGSVKGVVPREFISRGGLVTNWGGLVSRDVAEHALFLILSCLRNLSQWYPNAPTEAHRWGSGQTLETRSLRGKTLGIHGFGGIARELIQLLKHFDVRCTAFSPKVPDSYMQEFGVVPCHDIRELFVKSHIVVECEALTPETTRMITEEHFNLMRPDGIFVNVARGALVDERALEKVVRTQRCRIASDVFTSEPLPENSALRNRPGIVISPHIGGPTGDTYARCGEFALKNLQRYLEGQSLEDVVSLEIYDRST